MELKFFIYLSSCSLHLPTNNRRVVYYQKKKKKKSHQKSFCRNSICNDPKLVLGSNTKGPNNKFVEREYKRTRLTSKEKRWNFTFLDGLIQILQSIYPWNQLSSCFARFSSKYQLFKSSYPFSQCILPCYILPFWCHLYHIRVGWIRGIPSCPIQHFLEPSTSNCKAVSSLFRHHLHINAVRELVERQLMRRQQLLKIFVYLFFLTLGPMSHL